MHNHFSHDQPSEARGPVSQPQNFPFESRRSTRAPYKVWQYDLPSKTISRLLDELARGLNGVSGIRRR